MLRFSCQQSYIYKHVYALHVSDVEISFLCAHVEKKISKIGIKILSANVIFIPTCSIIRYRKKNLIGAGALSLNSVHEKHVALLHFNNNNKKKTS